MNEGGIVSVLMLALVGDNEVKLYRSNNNNNRSFLKCKNGGTIFAIKAISASRAKKNFAITSVAQYRKMSPPTY